MDFNLRNYGLRIKLMVTFSGLVFFGLLLASGFALTQLYEFKEEEIRTNKESTTENLKSNLRRLSEVAYQSVANGYELMHSESFMEKHFGPALQNGVEGVFRLVEHEHERIRAQKKNELIEQAEMLRMIKDIRFGEQESGYVFIFTAEEEPLIVAHPIFPEAEGTMTGPHLALPGKEQTSKAIKEMAKLAKEKGFGFYFYDFLNPDTGKVERKLSYFRYFPEWNWVVTTGVSVKGFEEEIRKRLIVQVKNMRFDEGNGYFWITTDEKPRPTVVYDYRSPELVGKKVPGIYKDINGNELFLSFVTAALERDGFTEYQYSREGGSEKLDKLAHSIHFKPYGWIISTAVYLDAYEKEHMAFLERVESKASSITILMIGMSLLLLAGSLLVAFLFSREITHIVERVKEAMLKMSKGESVEEIEIQNLGQDELGQMVLSMNRMREGVGEYARFAQDIGDGNLESEFKPLGNEDRLGNSLLLMRDNLKTVAEEEKLRTWHNEGLAKFGNMLRDSTSENMLATVLSELIKYVKANQGAFFIVSDSEEEARTLKMEACYAYGRKKFINKEIAVGEGLAGETFREGMTRLMTEIPEDYLNITSGLGKALPKCLILVPLKLNDTVLGVLELATFHVWDEAEVEFLEKICESVAVAVANRRTNVRTEHLLRESQVLTEELRTQEEEMRQNMEEMQVTQSELARKNLASEIHEQGFDRYGFILEMDDQGEVKGGNKFALEQLGGKKAVVGKYFGEFVADQHFNGEEFCGLLKQRNSLALQTRLRMEDGTEQMFAGMMTYMKQESAVRMIGFLPNVINSSVVD
ncbi:hypothetical protein FUAX_37530 [Fulvitalea axinellae]|uniref:histidine kinase n=1 Tax=Fulvitalea axinellae TaxID=1182444 RepID=A0AAU9DDQ6_9BACT|nr:hypothetical protein FUAX_37530 [Fulvitalea axinellae]